MEEKHPEPGAATATIVRLGLRENLPQFSLLVLVNAFVGGMVGLERTVVPLIGTQEFGIGSEVVVFSFIITFGLIKACVNLVSGWLADRVTRKTVLVAGWLVGLPVPFMLAYGPSWAWIVGANVLLGMSQGLAWSMTVNMKIDLVGPRQRGLAMGLNEAAGYGALGLTALATGYLAAWYGLRPEPFYHRDRLFRAGSGAVGPPRARHPRTRPARSDPAQPSRPGAHALVGAHLCRNQLAEPDALRRVAGGARQQPERRDVVGRLSAAVRRERRQSGRGRADQGGLPGDLGRRDRSSPGRSPIVSDASR